MKQLGNIGSRMDKYWFRVCDKSLKTARLLTMMPLNPNCPLTVCPSTKDVLNNLFLVLQHPYICPVFHVDFFEYEDQTYIVLVQPINKCSLKDLIYDENPIEQGCLLPITRRIFLNTLYDLASKSLEERHRINILTKINVLWQFYRPYWAEDWIHKYAAGGKGLELPQVQQIGRQILEALVFLKQQGFPTVTHLHSGNVVIQDGVARLTSLENTLLGCASRIHPVVTSQLTDAISIDIICFGHMLFEMCAGYELCTFRPSAVQLADIEEKYPQVVSFLELIFTESENHFTSIEELLIHDLFKNIDLREMQRATETRFRPMPSFIKELLDGIKRQDGKEITSIDSKDSGTLSFEGRKTIGQEEDSKDSGTLSFEGRKTIGQEDSKDGVSLNSFNGSLLTQICNELSQTAL